MPPFILSRFDCVGEVRLWRGDDLDALLTMRDENRAAYDDKQLGFRVTDEDDPERGDAEWCEICGAHGAFGLDGYCDLCEQGIEEEEAVA